MLDVWLFILLLRLRSIVPLVYALSKQGLGYLFVDFAKLHKHLFVALDCLAHTLVKLGI
jgi:hypothetical protein